MLKYYFKCFHHHISELEINLHGATKECKRGIYCGCVRGILHQKYVFWVINTACRALKGGSEVCSLRNFVNPSSLQETSSAKEEAIHFSEFCIPFILDYPDCVLIIKPMLCLAFMWHFIILWFYYFFLFYLLSSLFDHCSINIYFWSFFIVLVCIEINFLTCYVLSVTCKALWNLICFKGAI